MDIDKIISWVEQEVSALYLSLKEDTSKYDKNIIIKEGHNHSLNNWAYYIELILLERINSNDYGLVILTRVTQVAPNIKVEVDVSKSYGPLIDEKKVIIQDSNTIARNNISDTLKMMRLVTIKSLEENYI